MSKASRLRAGFTEGDDNLRAMRLAFGTDQEGPVTAHVLDRLRGSGHHVEPLLKAAEWPEVGRVVGEAVAAGRADFGVVFCHTGTGVSIAANKVRGVRAALCRDAETARGARRWNDANVVAIALSATDEEEAESIVEAFLEESADPTEAAAIGRVEA